MYILTCFVVEIQNLDNKSKNSPVYSALLCIVYFTMHRRRSTEVNQTLHDVWPSPGLVHFIYISGVSSLLTEFCQVQNSLCVQVFRSPILAALLHGSRAVGVSQTLQRAWHKERNGITELSLVVIFNRGRHQYSHGGHHVAHRPTF